MIPNRTMCNILVDIPSVLISLCMWDFVDTEGVMSWNFYLRLPGDPFSEVVNLPVRFELL